MQMSLLILSLPTENTTARMRAWRALKACGAAVLRDGVYALPLSGESPAASGLQTIAADVRDNGGTARVLQADAGDEDLAPLFDRSAEFAALLADIASARGDSSRSDSSRGDTSSSHAAALRGARKLRKTFEQIAAIDFFAGQAQQQALSALQALEATVARAASPDEPQAQAARAVAVQSRAAHQGRVWATRARPGVDRLASAWLIRRFIDTRARFLWLRRVADCPAPAVGFDFDGATFTHVGARVTFETLLASFGLETPALLRLGLIVHSLDTGGVQPPEAAGIEPVLDGMCAAIKDDDALFIAAAGIFESLHISFERAAADFAAKPTNGTPPTHPRRSP